MVVLLAFTVNGIAIVNSSKPRDFWEQNTSLLIRHPVKRMGKLVSILIVIVLGMVSAYFVGAAKDAVSAYKLLATITLTISGILLIISVDLWHQGGEAGANLMDELDELKREPSLQDHYQRLAELADQHRDREWCDDDYHIIANWFKEAGSMIGEILGEADRRKFCREHECPKQGLKAVHFRNSYKAAVKMIDVECEELRRRIRA